ncbi:MAG: hypothetical protein ACLUSP_10075 [Christensenellales bacterium]
MGTDQPRVNGSNDYVKFNLVAKNGEPKPVLDHGRIVNTEYFEEFSTF